MIRNNNLAKRYLDNIRKHLTKAQREEVIMQSGRSASLVEKVLIGERNNELILQYALVNSTLPIDTIERYLDKLQPSVVIESLKVLLEKQAV